MKTPPSIKMSGRKSYSSLLPLTLSLLVFSPPTFPAAEEGEIREEVEEDDDELAPAEMALGEILVTWLISIVFRSSLVKVVLSANVVVIFAFMDVFSSFEFTLTS